MKKFLLAVTIILGLGLLSFAYYAISPLFIHIKVDEAAPETSSAKSAEAQPQRDTAQLATVVGTAGHPASGTARIIAADGKQYVRYENFKTINGPDLYVYLAKDLDAAEYVSLGLLRATEGNINYEIPSSVDVSEYRYALTWCKQFGVLFNYAEISR
jgi:hypothetical protein